MNSPAKEGASHHPARRIILLLLALSAAVLFGLAACSASPDLPGPEATPVPNVFDGQRALDDVTTQVAFGPRTLGSSAHAQFRAWLVDELAGAGWQVTVQETEAMGRPVYNILATRSDADPVVILGAHYDSRRVADQDPDPSKRDRPVPGANDGASGVAVLLEIARVLPADSLPVWLVFFDAEDDGDLPGSDWILGSRAFADSLTVRPQAVVIVDMIGDADLNLYQERNSDPALTQAIWSQAAALGYETAFIPQPKYRMLDDHIPFKQLGLTVVDIIDFDYPYWHTTKDTPDKVSAESLQIVGETLLRWIGTLK
ncbi:MAG: M28 family peptidase [Chloroflexota bacterium]